MHTYNKETENFTLTFFFLILESVNTFFSHILFYFLWKSQADSNAKSTVRT